MFVCLLESQIEAEKSIPATRQKLYQLWLISKENMMPGHQMHTTTSVNLRILLTFFVFLTLQS